MKKVILATLMLALSGAASAEGFFSRLFGGSDDTKVEAKAEVNTNAADRADQAVAEGQENVAEMKSQAQAKKAEMKADAQAKKEEMAAKKAELKADAEARKAERAAKAEADAEARAEARAKAKADVKEAAAKTRETVKGLTNIGVNAEVSVGANAE